MTLVSSRSRRAPIAITGGVFTGESSVRLHDPYLLHIVSGLAKVIQLMNYTQGMCIIAYAYHGGLISQFLDCLNLTDLLVSFRIVRC